MCDFPLMYSYVPFLYSVPKNALNSGALPHGLILIEDFIDEEMEQRLIENIKWDSDAVRYAAESNSGKFAIKRVCEVW